MLRSWSLVPVEKYFHLNSVSGWARVYLHDDECHIAEVDGCLESGHSLGVSQTIQTGIIHLQQQVSFLQQQKIILWFIIHSLNKKCLSSPLYIFLVNRKHILYVFENIFKNIDS